MRPQHQQAVSGPLHLAIVIMLRAPCGMHWAAQLSGSLMLVLEHPPAASLMLHASYEMDIPRKPPLAAQPDKWGSLDKHQAETAATTCQFLSDTRGLTTCK